MKATAASQQKESELLQTREIEKKKLSDQDQELMLKYNWNMRQLNHYNR